MLLTRKQVLVLIAVIIASCGAWGVVLKMFLDSNLALKWACAWWFFGGCFVAAVICDSLENIGVFDEKPKATDRRIQDRKIKIEGDINPLLIAMKSKLTEVKQAAEKGIDRE